MILKKIELVEILKECYLTIFVMIIPHHSQDGSTYPGYKLMCFVNISFFRTEQNVPAFNQDTWCHLSLCLQMIPLSILNNNYQVLNCFGLLSSLSGTIFYHMEWYCEKTYSKNSTLTEINVILHFYL